MDKKLPRTPPAVDALRALTNVPYQHLSNEIELWRIYRRGGDHPGRWNQFRMYGPLASARYDQHEEPASVQNCGILYAAREGTTCFAECFQDTRVIDCADREPWLVGFQLTREIKLLDLTGDFVTAIGASQLLNTTGERRIARAYARAFYQAFSDIDGLWYPSSMAGNRPAVALFERAANAMQDRPFFHRALDDPAISTVIANAARKYNYGLILYGNG